MQLQELCLKGKNIFVFRDDLSHPIFNGNKARKLAYYKDHFPPNINSIISYGGNQSNMLPPLCYLANLNGAKLIYYTPTVAKQIKANRNIQSNYNFAIDNNATIIELEKAEYAERIKNINPAENELLIPQGGASEYAKYGMEQLAQQLKQLIKANNMQAVDIFIASGTGTSAYYLQLFMQENIYTTPCVGDAKYLKQQFENLPYYTKNISPKILNSSKKYHFGKCYPEFYNMYLEILNQNIEFELLYDMKSLQVIQENISTFKSNLIYVHCGGTYANQSMIARYKYLEAK